MEFNQAKEPNRAETAVVAGVTLLGSLASALTGGMLVVAEQTASVMKIVYLPVGVAAVVLTIIWLVKLRAFRDVPLSQILGPQVVFGGLLGQAAARACGASWTVTVGVLFGLLMFGDVTATGYLSAFFVHVVLSVALGSFALMFFPGYSGLGLGASDG